MSEQPVSEQPVNEVPPEAFPPIDLPIQPPFPPMEAKAVASIPTGEGWLYEPKWDGFRCLVFRAGDQVLLQSKSGQPLGRYFPEVIDAFRQAPDARFVVDGEIVVSRDGAFSFDDLLQRIHPAQSRVKRLATETPATFLAFDVLVDPAGDTLVTTPLSRRRPALEAVFSRWGERTGLTLSPASVDRATAETWMLDLAARGLDGIIAKRLDEPYRSGERTGMVKIKRMRTADCVVGGFRYAQSGGEIGSLLLGLYNDEGELDHVGFAASFSREERKTLKPIVEPLIEPPGFTGSAPGGPSRWSTERSAEWKPLRPTLVCEVRYDHFSGGRFRHGTKFLRWRPDKAPRQCTFEQLH